RPRAPAAGVRLTGTRPVAAASTPEPAAPTAPPGTSTPETTPGHELRQVLIAVPAAANGTQQSRAVTAVGAAADRPVRTMQAPLAAAIGAGIDPADPRPRLILDIGAGIVETAVIMRGRVHAARSVQYVPERPAGHRMPRLPEHVRDQVATALRHMLTDLPGPLRNTARAGGLLLTGGGACLPSLPGRLTTEMGLTISVARDPARATIRGLAHTCRSPALWRLTSA
ncbi:rod shape-determining protein, partial [Actinomadura sp. 7K534]|uniref:rod shape-determining protein n=1 Tax=Actinomadura sp. 7K534 TaxID=2530366 RepID=UPI0010DE8BDF